MASSENNNSVGGHLLHVGFMVPLNELMIDNEVLEHQLSHIKLRQNIYSAVLFYKDSNQDTLYGWFEQRKRSSRTGYLRAYYLNKKRDAVIEMDVDGKQFYLVASSVTSKPPIEIKRDVSRGLFGERKPFPERITVECFPYKCDADIGFIDCEAFINFKKEQVQKNECVKSE